jgi:hypothetical protein
MLANSKLTIVSEVIVDEAKIARFGAVLNLDNMELSMTSLHIDKEACKIHRDTVRADQKEFEDRAYYLQDMLSKDADK